VRRARVVPARTVAERRLGETPLRQSRRAGFGPVRRGIAALTAATSLLAVASPAAATPETLKRSASNILFGPMDIVFSPIVGPRSVYNGLRDVDDTLGVRVFYTIPGIAWNTGVIIFSGAMRFLAGSLELVPGVLLFFFRADLDPIYAPAERAAALINVDTPPLYIKFGINYTVVPF
jgi:hypothetical protein